MKRKIFSILFALVLLLTLGLVTATPAAAATINVSSGGSIQAAITAASDGDIINVGAGTYNENIDVNKRVILQASGTVTVNPASASDHIFHVTANHVTIDGFTLVGDTLDPESRGILLDGVTGCTISNNNWSSTVNGIAIYLNSANGNIIQGNTCTFTLAASPTGQGGIWLVTSDSNIVKDNTCSGAWENIWIDGSNNNTIQGNSCSGGFDTGGITLSGASAPCTGNAITGNTISCDDGFGIVIVAGGGTDSISDTDVIGNTLTLSANAIQLNSDGAPLINLTITENIFQSGISAAIVVVNNPTGSSIAISNNDLTGIKGIFIVGTADASLVRLGPDNSLTGYTDYAVWNMATQTLDATGNWWGTTVEADIETATIEDTGDIDFIGFLTTPPAAVGLTVEPDILPTVATSAASDVVSFTATLNGDLTNMGTAAQVDVWFEWGTTTSYGQTTPFETKTTAETFTAGLTGLTGDTDYHFRAVARSADGTTTGDDATFHTVDSLAVTTQAATSVDIYSATLNGDLTDLGSASSVDLSFEWKISGGTYAAVTATPPSASSVPTGFTYDLTGLTHNTTYYFRAKAVGTTMVYGDELSFTTVAEIIGLSVSPTSIDFGSILAGSASPIKTVTVTNEGNIVEEFSASLSAQSPADFYTDNLAIDSVTVIAWSATNIAIDADATPDLQLTMPSAATTGPKTATIIFWAAKN